MGEAKADKHEGGCCEHDCVARAREVLLTEAQAVQALAERLDDSFCRAVSLVLNSAGRTVVTGVGKSGAVGRKIAGTLASTGTPSLFLHPAEGVHGDLGMVVRGDVLLVLSYSGATDEILAILPAMKRIAVPVIANSTSRTVAVCGTFAQASPVRMISPAVSNSFRPRLPEGWRRA